MRNSARNWTLGNLKLDDIKSIVKQRFNPEVFKPDAYWMIYWVDRYFVDGKNNLLFNALVVEVKYFNFRNLDFSKAQMVQLPLRLIRILPSGTIIKDGVVLFKAQKNYLRKRTITINSLTLNHLELHQWKNYRDLMYALGFAKFDRVKTADLTKLTEFSPRSRIYAFDISLTSRRFNKEYIVFQDADLARFYWFTSTRMMQVLLTPGTVCKHQNRLWVPSSVVTPTIADRHHYLHIRDQMYLRDAHVISRIAFDDTASQSAKLISTSVLNREMEGGNNSSFYPKTAFPFKGSSKISFYLIDLRIEKTKITLVLEMSSCSVELPFKSLRYDRETEEVVEDLTKKTSGEKRTFINKPKETKNTNDNDPEDDFKEGTDFSKYDPLFDKDKFDDGPKPT
ncbi:MAG: hypothetical protein HYZ44_03540 [Bacteroidetes bacterium]|nr:hypothetical protein [Bacteroidota bacterium]